MPYIEVYDFDADTAQRTEATRAITDSLALTYEISASIITVFFHSVTPQNYGHEGFFGDKAAPGRIFIKLHAYPRSDQMRRNAAVRITASVAAAYGASPACIALYFLERQTNEVAHAGRLACDE